MLKGLIQKVVPSWGSIALAGSSAVLLALAFPDFEFWFLAYFALIPLLVAIWREKDSFARSFFAGWMFGVIFFASTCWWLTFAPITYGGVPAVVTWFLLFCACSVVGLFPGLFGGLLSICIKRFDAWGILAAPFLWVAIEYLRFWLTGNNWNAIAYSQAYNEKLLQYAAFGGIYLTGFWVVIANLGVAIGLLLPFLVYSSLTIGLLRNISRIRKNDLGNVTEVVPSGPPITDRQRTVLGVGLAVGLVGGLLSTFVTSKPPESIATKPPIVAQILAVQPNVPMHGLEYYESRIHRDNHIEMAEKLIGKTDPAKPKITIFPESPMNFMYDRDREFQDFIARFAKRNNTSILLNSAEPTDDDKSYFNSAVLIDENGKEIAQYDKMYLVPFGEFVPLPEPIASYVPSMVGRFSKGTEYDLLPFGDAKAGVMICFESHFPTLSREYARTGADVLVEMTNDGYLGPTPILRQHLANAVFRAVETGRPVLRVTNVGITAYIDEVGRVHEPSKPYTEDTRVWTVSKSSGEQTFYVKYGDWFAWVCVSISCVLMLFAYVRRKPSES